MKFQMFYLLFWILVSDVVSYAWSSSVNSLLSSKSISDNLNVNIVDSIAAGVQMAMDHCQEQFKWHRWNCPQTAFSRKRMQFLTKEIAYTLAVASAGIVHAISKKCSNGDLENCGCDVNLRFRQSNNQTTVFHQKQLSNGKNQEVEWSWGGCSDDSVYAEGIAGKFFEELEKGNDAYAFVQKHNSKLGREIIRHTMVKKCRCHGVSGSCSLQTCWMQVAPFSVIAKMLKERYNKAVRISFEQIRGARTVGNSARHILEEKLTDINQKRLLYLEESPNYCTEDKNMDWMGTKGRKCSRSHEKDTDHVEKKSCRDLCRNCGYKVKRDKKMVNYRCNCVFQWCCEVKCDTCMKNVDEYFCA